MPLVKKEGDKYIVALSDEDQKEFTKLEWCRAQAIFNGICQRVKTDGWNEGYRNNMAVNLMITGRMLGITEGDNNQEIIELLDLPFDDEVDLASRMETIEGYVERWIFDNPIAYILDEGYYSSFAKEEDPVVIVFN